MSYVVKAAIENPKAKTFVFIRMRTMYGGVRIAVGDEIFVFASETEGGTGLIARGVVTAAEAHKKPKGVARWTPRVSVAVRVTARAKKAMGREQLKAWRGVDDSSPQAELDFKFYRQATNKIGGIGEGAALFLRRCF